MLETFSRSVFGMDESAVNFERSLKTYKLKNKIAQRRRSKKRLGDPDHIVNLMTDNGRMWVGTVYMGGFTPMDVVFDTGSDWLVIEGSMCENCEDNTYNPNITGQ
jgi:hypothetical protein